MFEALVVSVVAEAANDVPFVLVQMMASVPEVVQSPLRSPLVTELAPENFVRFPLAGLPVVVNVPAFGVLNPRVTVLLFTAFAVSTWFAVGAVLGSNKVNGPAATCGAIVTVPLVLPASDNEPRVPEFAVPVPATPKVGVALKLGSALAP
jgi:hypothetical protein